jgi:retron-type reverse transcriptase
MKSHKNLYPQIYDIKNLILAYKKARKGKSKKDYVIEFERCLGKNLRQLQKELFLEIYFPKNLASFILRDPKVRIISKSDFRDRIVHHAVCNVIESIFQKTFIYSSCANQKKKGTLFGITIFEKYKRKVTQNLSKEAFCLKCDIKKYFENVNLKILLNIISKKIKCKSTIVLIEKILYNFSNKKGMPLGNLTSQFFANIYLNKLDYFIKHKLRCKYYIRYVDDFIILDKSNKYLRSIKNKIDIFLKEKLKIELHKKKTKIIFLSSCIDFIGFRNYYYHRLPRKRNILSMKRKIKLFNQNKISKEKFNEILNGWIAYVKWSDSYSPIRNLNIFNQNNN